MREGEREGGGDGDESQKKCDKNQRHRQTRHGGGEGGTLITVLESPTKWILKAMATTLPQPSWNTLTEVYIHSSLITNQLPIRYNCKLVSYEYSNNTSVPVQLLLSIAAYGSLL